MASIGKNTLNPTLLSRSRESSIIYQIFQEHLNTFLHPPDSERSLPWHVQKELYDFLDCGILARGFVRIYCTGCKQNQLVALSCKHRGFCPSCGGRRMRERSLHLVDKVLPKVPVRQWVLSLPVRFRYLVAYKPKLITFLLQVYTSSINSYIRKHARRKGFKKIHTGSVTVIQRAGSALNLNVHFHGLFLDGFYATAPGSSHLRFHRVPASTSDEMVRILKKIQRQVTRKLDGMESEDLTSCELFGAASASYRSVNASEKGRRIRMLGSDPLAQPHFESKRCIGFEGFSLHANTRISARNRSGLEKLCGYISRPPVSNHRLSLRANGDVLLHLKRPFSDGTKYVLFEPLEFIEKLAALVPPPWANLIRYHGCFAPGSKVRKMIVPKCDSFSTARKPHMAAILKRSFEIDLFTCSRCGGKTIVTAAILDSSTIKQFLQSMGLPTKAPEIAPSRASPQPDFDWGC